MRNVRWLVAAGLLVSATGCVETNGYPSAYYGGYPSGYGGYPGSSYYGSSYGGYYSQPIYYQPARTRYVPVAVPQTRYVPVPSSRPHPRSSWGKRDNDRDGIPNRYDRDRNNDGIPDRRRRWNRSG